MPPCDAIIPLIAIVIYVQEHLNGQITVDQHALCAVTPQRFNDGSAQNYTLVQNYTETKKLS
jgi:hypothetical protein